MNDIKLDGDAAVVGGVHSDSHDTHTTYQNTTNSNTVNNTTNTVNNTTVHEATKSREEVFLDNENQFMQTVEQYVSNDGRLDQLEYASLSQLAVRLRIAPQRATQIIDIVRRKYSIAMAGKGPVGHQVFACIKGVKPVCSRCDILIPVDARSADDFTAVIALKSRRQ